MFLEGVAPYALTSNEKARFLKAQLDELLVHHEQKCAPYALSRPKRKIVAKRTTFPT